MSRASVTACLIVRDEEQRLPAALDSVRFCDEVVVVDSGSTDRTLEIARAAGAIVVENAWPGFGAQRNVAIDHATSDWILEVDADERVTPQLAAEIEAFLARRERDYVITGVPMRHRFLGRELGPSVNYPMYRCRLFRRGAYRHDEDRTVHEGLWPRDAMWPFTADMTHELAHDWREALTDARTYARLEAAQFSPPADARSVVRGVVLRPLAKVAYRLVIAAGWRDGWQGVARIGLDAGADAAVWIHALRSGNATGEHGHFGVPERAGALRILAIASGADGAARAAGWLAGAAREGADVAMVADVAPAGDDVRVRRIARTTPLQLLRALDAERQLRAVDAVLVSGRRAERALALLPRRAIGALVRIAPGDPVTATLERVRAEARG